MDHFSSVVDNYILQTNKDGHYCWRPFELIHPAIYVHLVHKITEDESWQLLLERFGEFQSNTKLCVQAFQENLKKMEFLIRQKLYQDGGVMLNKNLSINLFSLNTCSVLISQIFIHQFIPIPYLGQFTQKKMLKQQEEQVEILETKLIMPYDRCDGAD